MTTNNEHGEVQLMIDELVQKGLKALDEYQNYDQEKIDYIVAKSSVQALDAHGILAKHAVEETQRGVFEDKATKNLFSCEHVTNSMRGMKTVGIIEEDEIKGLTYIAEPLGVLAGLIPTTNPTSTVIFKSLIALKTRNPIIFSFHPSAFECSKHAAEIVRDAAVKAGAPEDCIQWVPQVSMEATDALMNHDGVASILATGGNAMVRSAYSCGKPALGVGAGNVPAYIEKTANIKQAVHDIVLSRTFDNGMICASEESIVIDAEIYDDVVKEFESYHAVILNAAQKAKLEEFSFGVKAHSENCAGAKLNAGMVGKSATWIAKEAGFEVPEKTGLLLVELSEIGEVEPLTREILAPILPLIKVHSREEGLQKSADIVNFDGLGHSAAIHTNDKALVDEFGERVNVMRIIWNSPSTFGGIGDVYNAFEPSLTLGCGSYGRNSVGENVTAKHLLNVKKVGKRRNNMQWFKIPRKVYFERDSIQYLKESYNVNRAMIITDKTMWKLGYVKKVTDQLYARNNHVDIEVFFDVEADPDITTVRRGAEIMKNFEPDTIIALGGGSPIDAAKVMWLFYERPEVDFRDLVQKFMDIRKRAFKFPSLGEKAKFIAIPTTSGTGAEVTPFAVISDKENNMKYPLADYALLPSIAIIDPALVMSVPASVAADTGMDVLTHALEAYVSVMASSYTDGLALQAIQMVFENLEASVKDCDYEARENMHHASTIAGMAFGNAFLGISHSMAHKIGGQFHTVHGRTNAILLPYVIRYNGTKPAKLSNWPKYNYYDADVRYQTVANLLGLPASTPEEGVASLAKAVFELGEKVGIEMNFKAQGIDQTEWDEKASDLAYLAYEDQCTPVNPRLAVVSDLEEILHDSYLGYGENPGRIKY